MQSWEYGVLSADKRDFAFTTEYESTEYPGGQVLEILNELGITGWELAGVQESRCGVHFWYFKRPHTEVALAQE